MTQKFDPALTPVSLTLKNALGHELTLHLENQAQMQHALRYYGAQGYTSGALPNEGATLPLLMFLVFDFRLIGVPANEIYVVADGEGAKLTIKLHGLPYKHRLNLPDRKAKMPMKVNFSRGGKQTDDEERKTGDGKFTYVQSVNFVGDGYIPTHLRWLAIPGSLDERGNVVRIYNQLPGADNEDLMRHLAERHFKNRPVPPLADKLQTPTEPYQPRAQGQPQDRAPAQAQA